MDNNNTRLIYGFKAPPAGLLDNITGLDAALSGPTPRTSGPSSGQAPLAGSTHRSGRHGSDAWPM